MIRRLWVAILLASLLTGCAKQAALSDTTITAASPGEFTQFRSELGTRFTPEHLTDFDTATQELQLDAMNRDVPTAAARELDMLKVANGKTVHAVTLLGWQARKARFLREIADLTKLLDADLAKQQQTAATGIPESVLSRIASEKDVIAKIQIHLDDTEHRLAALTAGKPES